jgi:predicted phage terminase large subunit-like protein
VAETEERYLIERFGRRRVFRRSPGDVLQPARETRDDLDRVRQAMSAFGYAAQYQQNPIPLGGAIVKVDWLRYFEPGEEPTRFSIVIQSWDTANKSGELNDFSVCTTWGYLKGGFYLLDVCRKRLEFPDLKREVRRLYEKFGPQKILIEDKASGTQLLQELKNDGLYAVEAYTPPAGADKIMRLHAQTAPFENGAVWLRREAPWLKDYVSELTGFPGTRHADQVDSTTQALDYLRNTFAGSQLHITDELLARAKRPRLRKW